MSASDLTRPAEPPFPIAALLDCPTNLRSDPCPAEDAERAYGDDVLLYARGLAATIDRICRQQAALGMAIACPDAVPAD